MRPARAPRLRDANASTPVSSADAAHRRAACSGSIAQSLTPPRVPSAGAGSAMSQSSQYTPPLSASRGEVAAHTWVAAPCSGVLKASGSTSAPVSSIQPRSIISSLAR